MNLFVIVCWTLFTLVEVTTVFKVRAEGGGLAVQHQRSIGPMKSSSSAIEKLRAAVKMANNANISPPKIRVTRSRHDKQKKSCKVDEPTDRSSKRTREKIRRRVIFGSQTTRVSRIFFPAQPQTKPATLISGSRVASITEAGLRLLERQAVMISTTRKYREK